MGDPPREGDGGNGEVGGNGGADGGFGIQNAAQHLLGHPPVQTPKHTFPKPSKNLQMSGRPSAAHLVGEHWKVLRGLWEGFCLPT